MGSHSITQTAWGRGGPPRGPSLTGQEMLSFGRVPGGRNAEGSALGRTRLSRSAGLRGGGRGALGRIPALEFGKTCRTDSSSLKSSRRSQTAHTVGGKHSSCDPRDLHPNARPHPQVWGEVACPGFHLPLSLSLLWSQREAGSGRKPAPPPANPSSTAAGRGQEPGHPLDNMGDPATAGSLPPQREKSRKEKKIHFTESHPAVNMSPVGAPPPPRPYSP